MEVFANLLIDELQEVAESKYSDQEIEAAYLSISFVLLNLGGVRWVKPIVAYGKDLGFALRSVKVLHFVCRYCERFFAEKGIMQREESVLFPVIHSLCCFEIYKISESRSFLESAILSFEHALFCLKNNPEFELSLGVEHFKKMKSSSGCTPFDSSLFYNSVGEAFLHNYRQSCSLGDLVEAKRNLEKALSLNQTTPSIRLNYAKLYLLLANFHGKTFYIKEALKHFSIVIYTSFSKEGERRAGYEEARYYYAVAAEKQYALTLSTEHFFFAKQVLYETVQEFPQHTDLWVLFGNLFIQQGFRKKNPILIERGLEKHSFLRGRKDCSIELTASLASGISLLGLLVEEPNLFHESKRRLLSALKLFPDTPLIVYSLGVSQLCSGIYFQDSELLASAASCFRTCLEEGMDALVGEMLYEVYAAWGDLKKSCFLWRKALEISEKLCSFRPEVSLYWLKRGQALLALSLFSRESVYKEVFLEESLIHHEKAWKLSSEDGILESWGEVLYYLGLVNRDRAFLEEALEKYELLNNRIKILSNVLNIMKARLALSELFGDIKESYLAVEVGLEIEHLVADEEFFFLLGKAFSIVTLQDQRHFRRAEELLKRGLSNGFLESWYLLARMYAGIGKKDKAIECLQHFKKREETFAFQKVLEDPLFSAEYLGKQFTFQMDE